MNEIKTLIKPGQIDGLCKITGLSYAHLSGRLNGNRDTGKAAAIKLEKACEDMGIDLTKEQWIFGSVECLRKAIYNRRENEFNENEKSLIKKLMVDVLQNCIDGSESPTWSKGDVYNSHNEDNVNDQAVADEINRRIRKINDGLTVLKAEALK